MSTSGHFSPSGPEGSPASPGAALVPHLVGYEPLAASFVRVLAAGRLTHAYCLYGDQGLGKASFARALAAFIETGSFAPAAAPLIDCTVVGPGERGSISIDAARELRRFLWQTPFRSPRRIALVDQTETLTDEAQGALLKIVEEPPPHTLLLLVTHVPEALLPPLRSRLAGVYVPRRSTAEVRTLLASRGVPAVQAERVALQSFGRIGRAIAIAGLTVQTPVPGEAEPDLGETIESELVTAHLAGFRGYRPGTLRWLARRLELVRRYNLNPSLQRRAVEERLRESAHHVGS